MTGVVDVPGVTGGPGAAMADSLSGCLATSLDVVEAGDILGLPTGPLRAAYEEGLRRAGFPGDAYVLALVGGTGVGKSSLLNTLAGDVVSAASVRRPTTAEAVAWVPRSERASLDPLLEWLGVHEVHDHDAVTLGPVAILDLPDIDSVAREHRERVEALLPRVDAVVWVTDLEKYADAVLHDDFLRSWIPKLARQVVLINKADRVADDDGRRIQRELQADLRRELGAEGRDVAVLLSSTLRDGGTDDLRAWLAAGVDAKAVVRGRIAATLLAGIRDVARAAGVDPVRSTTPFLAENERADAIRAATAAALRTVDLDGLRAQAAAATRASARSRGTGPLGRVTSFLYRASGRETAVADPNRFLQRWRDRGAIGPAVEAIRGALATSIVAASPVVRPILAATVEPGQISRGLEGAIDRAIGGVGRLDAPTSRWWSVIGLGQTIATVGLALSAAWVVVWILARPTTGSVDLPVVGPVPSPFVSLIAFVLAGYVLARVLGLHAGWVGRRWADSLGDRVATAVESEIRDRTFAPLDRLEDARGRLATAARRAESGCRLGSS